MERKLIYPAIYKHFKNKFYAAMGLLIPIEEGKIKEIVNRPNSIYFLAEHTETGNRIIIARNKKQFYVSVQYIKEPMVLYKSLYDGHMPYIRPLKMFLSEVDKEKYPKVQQQYRFELVKY